LTIGALTPKLFLIEWFFPVDRSSNPQKMVMAARDDIGGLLRYHVDWWCVALVSHYWPLHGMVDRNACSALTGSGRPPLFMSTQD
jgi:hypothetical protein